MNPHIKQPPEAVGLYDPGYEHDACGVGMVARLDNEPTHEVIARAITALENLEHRGASGADPTHGRRRGDPDADARRAAARGGRLRAAAARLLRRADVLPADRRRPSGASVEPLLERTVEAEGQRLLGWRDVPVRPRARGRGGGRLPSGDPPAVRGGGPRARRRPGRLRAQAVRDPPRLRARAGRASLYVASSSSRTLNYKGMLISFQLAAFYPDLRDERCRSALALVHSRFSTNTFPSWELAHPYRVICHNGEINTVRGNVNWMRARESELRSELFGEDLPKILPVVSAGQLGLGDVRQRARAADARRALAAARGDDDDPGGLPRPRRPAGGPEGLLRLPLLPDGAVGRPGLGRVHRRARGRRHARPQRAAPGPLGGDERRARRARLRERAARHPAGADAPARPPAAGQAVPGRPRARADRRGRGGQARGSPRAGRTASGTSAARCPSRSWTRPTR